MKKYRLLLTALLGAAFLFAPRENVSAAEPSDTISVSYAQTAEGTESEWLSGYYYELVDDGVNEPVAVLKKCYLSGAVSVPGTAVADGKTFRTLITKECFSNCIGITSLSFLETDGIKPLAGEDMTDAFSKDPYLESIDISGLDLSKTVNIDGMFSKNERLSSLLLSNSTLGTFYDESKVSARRLFSESPSITELDLSGFDTTNVVNMSYIFSSMKGIRSFMFGGAFDTSNVRDLSYAFYDCPSFTGTLDLSAWNVPGKSSTANNTTMRSMFELFPARNMILTGFNTTNVIEMSYAFANTSFSGIDISSFDTSKVESMYGMFDGTKVANDFLDWITLGNKWDTSGVKSFSRMFNQRYITNSCANVFAAKTDVKRASSLYQMFYDTKVNCDSDHKTLSGAVLNLSTWDVSSVTDFRRFLKSGSVSVNLTGWKCSSIRYGNDAFGGMAKIATPAATAEAIESNLVPQSELDDSSKFNSYFYQRGYAGHTKDGRDFMKAADSNYDNIHSIFGTTSLPIYYRVNVTLSYYNQNNEFHTVNDPNGIYYSRTTATDSYAASLNRIQAPYTAEQEKWFCPYKAGLTTNGKEDRYYYEIYGYSDGRYAFKYAPTQSEWDATVKHCMYTGTINGFRDICNEGKYLTNRVYGFKEVDISEYVGNVEIQDPTVENGGLDLEGASGEDYSDVVEAFEMPFSNVNYVIGRENSHVIRPVEKKDFVFLGWFDTKGNNLTESSNGVYTPKGLMKEMIVPHYKVEEKEVNVQVTFDAGEGAPDGLSLSLDPDSSGCFSLSRDGDKWSGTFSTLIGPKDRTFSLPTLLIEGMDEEEPEYEFLGWEGEEESFTVSSNDTEKSFKAVFKHNEKPAEDPGADDPTQDDPTQDDPTQDDPTQDDPTQDDPTQDDPTQDDPTQDDPTQDDPTQDDPTQDDPTQDDPTQDEPTQDDPTQDEPTQDEPKQDDPTQDEPTQDDPTQDEPTQDDPTQDDPTQDDPTQDDPTQDDPTQDEPTQDDPTQDDPTQDDPTQDEPTQDDPTQDEPTQDEPTQDDPTQDEPKQDDPTQDDPTQDEPTQDEPTQDEPTQDDPAQDDPVHDEPAKDGDDPELSDRLKALNEELSALRAEKAEADSKNKELVDSLNKKIAELEAAINTLSLNMSKNDEIPASTESGTDEGSGSSRPSSGNTYSYSGQGTSGYQARNTAANSSTSGNTASKAPEAEKSSETVFGTSAYSPVNHTSKAAPATSAQPEPHYAYRASNGAVKLNYDSSVGSAAKGTVEEYGFFTEGTKSQGNNASSSKLPQKTSASSDEMKKAAGNTGTHDGGLLEAQNVGRSIFGVMILVIITGCAIFFTFRKKAVKKNRRTRK